MPVEYRQKAGIFIMKTHASTDKLTRDYLDSWMIQPSYIGSGTADITAEYFGETYRSPIMISTLSGMTGVNPGGNVLLATAADMTGTLDWNGVLPKEEGLQILAQGTRAVLSSKPVADMDYVLDLIRTYAQHGAKGFVMDADFIFDPETGDVRNHPKFGQMGIKTIDDLKTMVRCSDLPVIIKGVLSVKDAEACLEAGISAIVISHHMGMIDSAVPPYYVLPEIRKAVGNQLTIFGDCGIRSGADAFKALVLGCDGVLVARPLMKPFAEGPEKAAEVLDQMSAELRFCMSITSSRNLKHLNGNSLVRRDF